MKSLVFYSHILCLQNMNDMGEFCSSSRNKEVTLETALSANISKVLTYLTRHNDILRLMIHRKTKLLD